MLKFPLKIVTYLKLHTTIGISFQFVFGKMHVIWKTLCDIYNISFTAKLSLICGEEILREINP